MVKQNTLKRALLVTIFLAIVIATTILSYEVYAQAMGCCTNPNALLPCSPDMAYVDECCPFDDPNFYRNKTGYGPYDYEDCIANYFFTGTSCDNVSGCEIGCCCPPQGSPLIPEYSFKATCVAINHYFVGNISFFQNCTTICQTTPPPEVNVSACEHPQPQNLVAVHIKGKNNVRLTWNDECNATHFSVARCHGARPECSETDFETLSSYVTGTRYSDDDEELLWSISDVQKEVYTYRVTAHYYDQKHSSYASETRGDLECWGKYDTGAFCINLQKPYKIDPVKSYLVRLWDPQDNTDFNQKIIETFGIRFNKGYYCDNNNFLYMVTGCGDERYQVCTVDEDIVQCKKRSDCRRLGDPYNMNSSLESCEGNNRYCFFDRSRTSVDACYDCSPAMACYDYKTHGACERDNCNLGNCEWKPIQVQGASQLNLGVCVDTEGYNCKFCLKPEGTSGMENNDAYNPILDKCTDEKAMALSTERYNCSQELAFCRMRTCLNYTNGDECNKNGFLRRDITTNEILVGSDDLCGINVCNWRYNKCVKDADADEIPDCIAVDEVACEKDYFPPQTSLSWDDDVLRIKILDRTRFGGPLIDKSSNNNYKVYLCRYTGPRTCKIAPDNYQEFNGPEITRKTLVSRGLIRTGENTIKYFSRDAYKNLEIVKRTTIKVNPIVPFVLITSPEDGSTTMFKTITVSGIVQDWEVVDSASLLVNNRSVPLNLVQGEFSKNVSLREGANVLQAKVVTIEGVVSKSYPVNVIYRYIDPAITYIEPIQNSYIPSTTLTLKLQTNREGTCFYGTTQPPSLSSGTFGTFTMQHISAPLTMSTGNHTYYFKCNFLDRQGNTISLYAQTSFFIDVTAPRALLVDDSSNIPGIDPEYTYHTNRLYAKWFATDPESGVKAYNYSVYYISGTSQISVLGWRTTNRTNKWITGLRLSDGIKYYVKVKAQNNVGTWGNENSSDGVTVNTSIIPQQCRDGIKNGNETDIDCGGPQCLGCEDGEDCLQDIDCLSGFCNESQICATPTCNDYEQNQDETDIDCGGTVCRRCEEGEGCILNSDCEPELICKDYVCSPRISPYCGDGIITAPEQCDSSNWGLITSCKNFSFVGGNLSCRMNSPDPTRNCVFDTSQCIGPLPARCGDGIIQPGEQCDGSNWGIIQGCWNFDNFTEGQLRCVDCIFNTANCSRPPDRVCGDSIIQPGEQCDGSNWGAITGCNNFDNFTNGTLRCIGCRFNTNQCIGTHGGFCGDGIIQVGEECDGSDWGNIMDCTDLGYFIGGNLRCFNCSFNTELCTPPPKGICGNGIIDSGEQCDGSNWGNIYDCSDIGNFTEGTLRCIGCRFNTNQCNGGVTGFCGDGIVQTGEQCDGSNWGGIKDCTNFGYESGNLTCQSCRFNTSKCKEKPKDMCSNRQLDYGETDIDCGGICIIKGKLCSLGADCDSNEDCESKYCKEGRCSQKLLICESGETKECVVGVCEGTQMCVNGAWAECVKIDPECGVVKPGMPQILKLLIWLFILIILAVIGYFGLRYYQEKKKPKVPTPPRVAPRPVFRPGLRFEEERRRRLEEERRGRVESLREKLKEERRGVKEAEREELFKTFEVPKKEEKKEEKAPKKEAAVKKPEKAEKEDVFKKLRKETKRLKEATKKQAKK